MIKDHTKPHSFLAVFNQASMESPFNETVMRLGRDQRALFALREVLGDNGQTQFINLARTSQQARISMALYAGDGLVTKIIPEDYTNQTKNVIYHLPAISKTRLETQERNFVIKQYPWISPGKVTTKDVEIMRDRIENLGLAFNAGDASPKNIHRLPDKEKTLVGIDADMYHTVNGERAAEQELKDRWHEYLHRLFPIYDTKNIPRQSDETDFSFISIHNKDAEQHCFREQEEEYLVEESPPGLVEKLSLRGVTNLFRKR